MMFPGRRWSSLTWGLALLVIFWLGSRAAVADSTMIDSFSDHRSWEKAATIPSLHVGAIAYGQLRRAGDGRYYRFALSAPVTIAVELDNTRRGDTRFVPQLVVFQPEPSTIGPALPINQPPNTLALVYRSDQNDVIYDASTQTSYRRRLKEEISLPIAGTYYLAVYNTDGKSGRFRLALRAGRPLQLGSDGFVANWWRAQTWAGFGLSTLFLPLVVVTIITLAVWRSLKLLHPPRQARPHQSR